MIEQQLTKKAILVPPQLKDNGAPAGLTYVDTYGFDYAEFDVITGTTDIATTAAPKVQECDTTNGTYTDVTSAALADAPAATEDNKIFTIGVDLTKAHKRYMKVLLTAGNGTTGTNLCVMATLSRPRIGIDSATERGLTEWIQA